MDDQDEVVEERKPLIFRQLFERESCTYTYLLACGNTKQAVLIDPVLETVERDAEQVRALGVTLKYGVNTHCHADHISGTSKLKEEFPEMKTVISEASTCKADWLLKDGDLIKFGDLVLETAATPGHTNGCCTFILRGQNMAFTGDAVLIRGCGRTDFQEGNAGVLYESVQQHIFSLPHDTLLFPAHDYKGCTVTTVGEEKRFNPRLSRTKEQFVHIMNNLNMAYPKQIDKAVPANLACGAY